MPLVFLIAAAVICLTVHLAAMALSARATGIAIRRVSYGVGPTLFTSGILRVRAIPISGYVKMKDSREDLLEPHDLADAFDHQAVWKQVSVPLSGNAILVVFAVAILGAEGWSSFVAAFGQIFAGALSPLDTAQQYLSSFVAFSEQRSFVATLALVASKLAALNLLPFGSFNGGQIVLTLIRFGGPPRKFEDTLTRWGILLQLVLMVSWLFAAGAFVVTRTG